ncbi:hypothetical protein SAMN05216421_2742 [Halopseudomonas xinjiangensis]|uniref:Lipoprotein n=1 Tax=Halopseudomonas xinjiangensis TaxID=487184 RepID=A0A1H1X201_9GAMM|nr:hypothetical protein [Halopseudomonas xinjiangensis]SDT03328.1 hypothetical protein SAMN05216421_2742 [Halopseudomonas xinjiangensis]
MKQIILLSFVILSLSGCSVLEQLQSAGKQSHASHAMQLMQGANQAEGLADLAVHRSALDDRAALVTAAEVSLIRELTPANAGRAEPVVYPVQAAFMSFKGRTDPTLPLRDDLRFISWLPASQAADEQAAQLRWSEVLEQAVARALPQGYHTEPFEWVNTSADGVESTHRVLRVDGPLCSEWSCVLEGGFTSRENPDLSAEIPMQRVTTPPVAGHSEAESFTQTKAAHMTFSQVTSQYLEVGRGAQWRMEKQLVPGFDHNAFYQRLSAELPAWTFIYAGPENPVYQTQIPVVLHEGQEHFFAVPGGRR